LYVAATTFEYDAGKLHRAGSGASLLGASEALPSGAYSTLRTYGRDRILRLGQHVARLNESTALQGSVGSLEERSVREAIAQTLEATGHPESRLRLTFAPPRFFVSIEPFAPPAERLYQEGVAAVTVPVRRPNPRAKDTRFSAQAAKAYAALPSGIHEGLMVADDGSILEGLSSNFFALESGVLRTEEARVLLGVTRSLVLEVAEGLVPVSREAVRLGEVPVLTEAFITSASRGILPVVRIDGIPLGDGRPGAVTRSLMERFQALVDREAARIT
jgi:branched-chain amino acid aminotransferase